MHFNPYHQWLKLDPKIRKPNYFQLLEVQPDPIDETEFVKVVKESAKQKDRLLDQVKAAENSEQIEVIRKRIKQAFKILSDPDLREKYTRSLSLAQVKVAQQKVTQQNQAHKGTAKKSALKDTSSKKEDLTNQPKSAYFSTASVDLSEIPFAIPIRIHQPDQPVSVSQASEKPPRFAVDAESEEPTENSSSDKNPDEFFQSLQSSRSPKNERVIPASKYNRRKQTSNLAVVVVSLVAIAGFMGIIYFMLQLLSNQTAIQTTTLGPIGDSDIADHTPADPVAKRSLRQPQRPSGLASLADEKLQQIANPTDAPMKADQSYIDSIGQLSEFEQYQIINYLATIRLELFRNHSEGLKQTVNRSNRWMQSLANSVDRVFDGLTLTDVLHRDARQIIKFHDQFWNQVRAGAGAMTAGQSIEIEDTVYAFVGYEADSITVRVAGKNLTYPVQWLPAKLAIKIGEQASIPDVPEWRIQQALFLIGRNANHQTFKPIIGQLIADAESDGHNCQWLRRLFSDLDELETSVRVSEAADLQAQRESIRSHHDYNDLSQLSETQAAQIFDQLQQISSEDLSQVLAQQLESVELAVALKDPDRLHMAIVGMASLDYSKTNQKFLQGLAKISSADLNLDQTRRLIRVASLLDNPKPSFQVVFGLALPTGQATAESTEVIELIKQRIRTLSDQHNLEGVAEVYGRLR